MAYLIGVIPVFILIVSIGIGHLSQNWFVEFGLLIVALSSLASIALAIMNSVKAARAKKLAYSDFLPKFDDSQSYSFKYTAGIMGINIRDPIEQLRKQLDEVQRVAIQDEKIFRQRLQVAEYRIDICLAQIRYHEQATLPKILGNGAGLVILASVFAIIGSAYLAFPDYFYTTFATIAASLRTVFLR